MTAQDKNNDLRIAPAEIEALILQTVYDRLPDENKDSVQLLELVKVCRSWKVYVVQQVFGLLLI
jgi:hypothetical protein